MIDEAQKIFVGEGNDAEGHQARVLDGTGKFHEILGVEMIINETMADDGTAPMDFGECRTHDARTATDMSYDDVCAIAWR